MLSNEEKGMNLKIDKEKFSLRSIGMDKLAIIVACGIVLILCSVEDSEDKKEEKLEEVVYTYTTDEYEKNLEERLKNLLESMEGVGAVEVMVTVKETKEKVVLTEKPYSKTTLNESDSDGGVRTSEEESRDYNTVYVTDDSGNTVPYVVNEIMPEIEGVAIIAKGGDSVAVKEKIINVVKSLFNVDANKISISKMK